MHERKQTQAGKELLERIRDCTFYMHTEPVQAVYSFQLRWKLRSHRAVGAAFKEGG